ncbi:hypothetical protein Taro_014621 [Colocasia esculenta]|uniref:EF-hand domain-containing protein n=1 Tax=Colocasia esculenta TaxID=4460 RepID=A0A843UFA7_COLES|nr:hypothetical protein [Colocasia esculenta]
MKGDPLAPPFPPPGSCTEGAAVEARGSLRPAFDVLDVDHNGRIGRDDLKAFYSGGGSEDEAIGSMIAAADADRDGYVAFEEFEWVVLRGGGGGDSGGGGMMEEVFWVMDRDGDRRVGFADLRGYMDWAALRHQRRRPGDVADGRRRG